ncbi:MAG: DUF3095 family protein [Pseudomonadota bacterium]
MDTNSEPDATCSFVQSLPILEKFRDTFPKENYVPLPQDWLIAVTDVVSSRKAIGEGKYKEVNMAGVAMITAIMNAVGHQCLPYSFGGDGAAVVVAPELSETVAKALGQTISWVHDDLGLELRAALVPLSEIVGKGTEVHIAQVRVSDAITNFAFVGGGIGYAEQQMKDGNYRIAASEDGSHPDLSGLSCRWTPIKQDDGKIISLIVEPAVGDHQVDEAVLLDVLKIMNEEAAEGHPIDGAGPTFKWPPEKLQLEARATGMSMFALYLITLIAWILDRTKVKLGGFDPVHYRKQTGLNTDYRKIQDGLRMTQCVDSQTLERLRVFLEDARGQNKLRFGISEQDQAVLTCFVPSITTDSHFHFLDGAGGGYAAAASDLH